MSISLVATAQTANIWMRNCLNNSTSLYQNTLEQLSSGTKFVKFSDDPVDATKAAQLSTQITSNTQIQSVVEVSKSVVSLAQDTQESVLSDLERIRDLCTEAANGTYSASDKDSILSEIKQRLNAIDFTADSTNYDGVKLLNGDSSNYTIQIGIGSTDTMNIGGALIDVHASQLGTGTNINLIIPDTVNGSNWTGADIATYMDKIDSAIAQLTDTEAQLGGYSNSLDNRSEFLSNISSNLTNYKSAISDTDTAEASADIVRYQIMQEASVNLLVQANDVASLAFSLLSASS